MSVAIAAHMVLAVVAIVAVTMLAIKGAVPGNVAVSAIIGTLTIAGGGAASAVYSTKTQGADDSDKGK
jgi:hypothetical protein